MQPLFINLTGKKVVIVGGGKIAARKAIALEAEQADITFIAPDFCDEVIKISEEKGFIRIHRKVMSGDFEQALLVILATNDRDMNRTLAQQLSSQQLVCVVDEAENGNVIFPAAIQRGHLQIAVTTNGASPKLTRKLKQELESQFDRSWETYLAFLSQCRHKIKKLDLSYEEKDKLLEEILVDRYRADVGAQREVIAQMEKFPQITDDYKK